MGDTCIACDGSGKVSGYACPGFRPVTFDCFGCNGKGVVDDVTRLWKEIGETMRACRLARDKSQREFADWIGADVVTLSKAEAGRIDPRPTEKLLRTKIDTGIGRITGR